MNGNEFYDLIASEVARLREGDLAPEEFVDGLIGRIYPDQTSEPGRPLYPDRDSWAWDYAAAVSEHVYHLVKSEPAVSDFRKRFREGSANSLEGIWDYLRTLVRASGADSLDKPASSGFESLRLAFGEGMDALTLPKSPVEELDELLSIVRVLSSKYRVPSGWVLITILSDNLQPLLPSAPTAARFRPSSHPFMERIVLEVDPAMPPTEVANLYRKSRSRMSMRGKAITRKQLKLLELAARHPDEDWPALIEKWANMGQRSGDKTQYVPPKPKTQDLTDPRYEETVKKWSTQQRNALSNFRRDVNTAWRAIFGSEPPKRSERGQAELGIAQQTLTTDSTDQTEKNNG